MFRPANAMAEQQLPPENHNLKVDSPSPAKKARQSPTPQPEPTQLPATKAAPPKRRTKFLPPMLSPTLPPSIETELARIERLELSKESKDLGHQKSAATASSLSDNKNLSSSHTPSPNSTKSLPNERRNVSSPKPPEKGPEKEPPAPESATKKPPVASEAKTATIKPEVTTKSVKREPQPSSLSSSLRGTSNPALTSASGTEAERFALRRAFLTVKLKYGKANKTLVQRLLNTKPQPKRTSEAKSVPKDKPREELRPERDRQRDKEGCGEKLQERQDDQKSKREPRGTNSKDTENARQKDPPKPPEKRPRPADEERPREPSSKRQKATETHSSKKVRNPAAPVSKSTAANAANGQKDQDATPKKQSQATTPTPMHRVGSSETHARTPQAPPGSAERVHGNGRDVHSLMPTSSGGMRMNESSGNKDIDAWRSEHTKYNQLGRDLKRQAEAFFREDDQKRALAAALECVLWVLSRPYFTRLSATNRLYTDAT
jgi:hypothetical protein